MYNAKEITPAMLNKLKMIDNESYLKYISLSQRGVEFTITQFFMYFLERGYGKTYMMWLNALYAFSNEKSKTRKFITGEDSLMIIGMVKNFFPDMEVVEKGHKSLIVSKIEYV